MQRVKSFTATGTPPNGVLFAGDLNAIQDDAAALEDFTQLIQLATVEIGESGLALVRYGSGEARLTGAFRMDGALRVGGLLFPLTGIQYPDGSVQTTAAVQVSSGHFIGEPIWGWPSLSLPSFGSEVWGWQDGSAISRTTYALLLAALAPSQSGIRNTGTPTVITALGSTAGFAVGMKVEGAGIPSNTTITSIDSLSQIHISNNVVSSGTGTVTVFPHGNGDGSTTFNLPDARGRAPVGLALSGGHVDVAGMGNNEGVTVTNRRFKHRHTNGTTLTGSVSDGITVSDNISFADEGHAHNIEAGPNGQPVGSGSADWQNGFGPSSTDTGFANLSKSGGAFRGGSVTNGSLAVSGLIGNSSSDALDSPPYLVLGAPIRMA